MGFFGQLLLSEFPRRACFLEIGHFLRLLKNCRGEYAQKRFLAPDICHPFGVFFFESSVSTALDIDTFDRRISEVVCEVVCGQNGQRRKSPDLRISFRTLVIVPSSRCLSF